MLNIWNRGGSTISKKEIDEVARKIQEWLADEGLFREKVKGAEKVYFQYVLQFPKGGGPQYNILQSKNEDKAVILATQINVNDVHKKALGKISRKDRDEFLWNIRFGLLDKIGFQMVPSAEKIESIQLSDKIYYEELTRDSLLRKIDNMYRCGLFFIWKFSEKFGKASEEDISPMFA